MLAVLKKYGWKIATINIIVVLLGTASSTGLMLYLFAGVWIGVYTIAEYSALMSSSGQFEGNLNSFFGTLSNFYKNSLQIDNLKFVYFYKKKSIGGTLALDLSKPIKVEVKNLYFKYPNSDKYALKNISIKIMPGEKVSLVGLNGSGKTTLIKLISGLYEPESGDILLNDINIREYNIEEVQKGIGIVFQDHQIFAYTVKENIAFEEEVQNTAIDALDNLGLYKNIQQLPKQMNTHLSKEFDPEGILLSGGEAQKICIARALNKKTGLYIFDEPSSALDPISEYKMNSLLYNTTSGTVIFISHRLTTTVMADKVFLLDYGELIEEGRHSELIKLNGPYANMFNTQAKNYGMGGSRNSEV